jgi:hypothetical protein
MKLTNMDKGTRRAKMNQKDRINILMFEKEF